MRSVSCATACDAPRVRARQVFDSDEERARAKAVKREIDAQAECVKPEEDEVAGNEDATRLVKTEPPELEDEAGELSAKKDEAEELSAKKDEDEAEELAETEAKKDEDKEHDEHDQELADYVLSVGLASADSWAGTGESSGPEPASSDPYV